MTGMYGCLSLTATTPVAPAITPPTDLNNPILWNNANQTLTLVTADIGTSGGTPTWTVISDCQTTSQVYTGARSPVAGQTAFPLRKLVYSLVSGELRLQVGTGTAQPILSNVRTFTVDFGVAGSPLSYTNTIGSNAVAANIRSVRLTLVLTDPNGRVRDQTYNVVAALRNRF